MFRSVVFALARTMGWWHTIPIAVVSGLLDRWTGIHFSIFAVALHVPFFIFRGIPVIAGAYVSWRVRIEGVPATQQHDEDDEVDEMPRRAESQLLRYRLATTSQDALFFGGVILGIRDLERRQPAGCIIPEEALLNVAQSMSMSEFGAATSIGQLVRCGFINRGPIFRGTQTYERGPFYSQALEVARQLQR